MDEEIIVLKSELKEKQKIIVVLKSELKETEKIINMLQQDIMETNDGIIALTLELEKRKAILGELAAGVSHELRNPLGAIKNAAYFLKMVLEEPEREVKECLEILEMEVASSEKIIRSILDFARPKPLNLSHVDIYGVIRNVLSHTIVPENVKILNQLDETVLPIQADLDKLTQVFENIILNAIQAMPEGGQLIIKYKVPTPEWMEISITDTGVGISQENMENIFKPLFTTKAKGIGLGLSVSKILINAHEGNIKVQSKVGKCSIFTVMLPIRERRKLTSK